MDAVCQLSYATDEVPPISLLRRTGIVFVAAFDLLIAAGFAFVALVMIEQEKMYISGSITAAVALLHLWTAVQLSIVRVDNWHRARTMQCAAFLCHLGLLILSFRLFRFALLRGGDWAGFGELILTIFTGALLLVGLVPLLYVIAATPRGAR